MGEITKLNLTDDEKPSLELPQNEYGIPIILFCTAVGFIVNFLLSGNPYYATGATIGSIILPGIITLVSLFFTKKWSYVFGIAWILLFMMWLAGQVLQN